MRVARVVSIVALAGVLGVLGALQVLGTLAVRDRAQPGAWVRVVPERFGRRVDALETTLPLPGALRIVLARHAVARGQLALAARDVAQVRSPGERLALEGRLAEERNDAAAATADYLAAGDLAAVQGIARAFARRGDLGRALQLERSVIARLEADRTQGDALAEAYVQLGLLQQAYAYHLPALSGERRATELAAVRADEQAVELAPLSLRYLVVFGNEQLNLGQLDEAQRTFARAHDIDPTSAEPLAGLADAALRRGDVAAARAYLRQGRALDPASDAVRRVTARLGA